jgi:D-beta-D-heptose 7-phosphate kinase/D-beta-D-heptose 1-phosphate adenosyltransferase
VGLHRDGLRALGRGLSWQALYTQASNLAFRTYGVGDNFEDGGVGIGRGYPDMDYLSLGIGIPVANRWLISPDAVFQRQGASRITDPTPQDPADIRDTPAFLSKPIEYGYRLGVTFSGRQGPLEVQGSGGLYYVTNGKRGRRERRAIRGKIQAVLRIGKRGRSSDARRDAAQSCAPRDHGEVHHAPVAVVGDLMLDRYLLGDIERISPEAPVPVVLVSSRRDALGGAANVAANVVAAGARCHLVGAVGNDPAGAALRDALAAGGIDGSRVRSLPDRPTTTKTRVVARGQQVCRVDEEVDHDLTDDGFKQVTRLALEALEDSDVLLLEDYDKGTLTPSMIPVLVDRARSLRVPVVVDPKYRHFYSFAGATVFKPNRRELESALGTPIDQAAPDPYRSAYRRANAEHLLVTLGADGWRW